jgi:hypothetical protein
VGYSDEIRRDRKKLPNYQFALSSMPRQMDKRRIESKDDQCKFAAKGVYNPSCKAKVKCFTALVHDLDISFARVKLISCDGV